MEAIVPFEFKGHQVRVIRRDDHEEWIAKDVCEALTIEDPTSAVRGLDDDEKGRFTELEPGPVTERSGGIPRTYVTVTEPGLYRLILCSRKPAAREFSRWVTHEVLPQIRRTGAYVRDGDEMRVIEMLVTKVEASDKALAELRSSVASLLHAHPYGMLGNDARVLRGQMSEVARMRSALGDTRLPVTVFNEVDGEVRDAIGYSKRAGATWERCPNELQGKAFSLVARMHTKAKRSLARAAARGLLYPKKQPDLPSVN